MYLTIVKCFNKEHPQKPHAEIKACVDPHEYLFSSEEEENSCRAEILARIYNVQAARLFQRKVMREFQKRYVKKEKKTLSLVIGLIDTANINDSDKEYLQLKIADAFDLQLSNLNG